MLETSFRDPSGQVVIADDCVLRRVEPSAAATFRKFLGLEVTQRFVRDGLLIATEETEPSESPDVETDAVDDSAPVFRHERVPFISYPYEWSPNMLASAADLTLELARQTLEHGWGIKDATPYNILFRGPNPVFVDALSFEPRDPNDSFWLAYAQFTRTFLIPLLLDRRFAMPIAPTLLANRDGVRPSDVVRLFGRTARYRSPVFGLVTMPAALAKNAVGARRQRQHDSRRVANPAKARFIVESLYSRASKQLRKVEPVSERSSIWTDYVDAHHTPQYHESKRVIVDDFMKTRAPASVLDVGCNTGDYSAIAARGGARVVSIDYDESVIGRLWSRAKRERLDILPLVVNIARPSPAVGWMNRECASFLERAEGAFEAVFMLALMHHLLVTERVPFEQIIALAARMTRLYCIIEFVPSDDPKFQELTGGWNDLYAGWSHDAFRHHCNRCFETLVEYPLKDSNRWLHVLKKRTDGVSGSI